MRLSYHDQLKREWGKAVKAGNELAARYYTENIGTTSACVSFERWIGSQAGQNWQKRIEAEQQLTRDQQIIMYDVRQGEANWRQI